MTEPGKRQSSVRSSADPVETVRGRRRPVPKRLRPSPERNSFVPGNGLCSVERLESRRLLSDLVADISQHVTSLQNGTFDLGSVSLGNNLLTSSDVSVTLSGVSEQSDGGYTASVTVDATNASLQAGSLTGTIAPTNGDTYGLTGSYQLTDQSPGSGTFKLNADSISVTVPGALTASATGLEIDYNASLPTGSGQPIATLSNASATLIPLNNATLTLKDLAIQDNGFTLQNGTVTAGSITLGSVVSVTAPSVTFSSVAYENGALSGTITASADTAQLFPGNTSLNASITDFKGTYTLGTGTLALQATSAGLTVGRILDAQSTDVGLTWDGTNATVSLGSVDLTSPLLPGASLSGTSITGNNQGFSIGQADLIAPDITLGGVLELKGLDLGVTDLNYVTATDALSGTFSISTTSATLLPGSTAFTTSLTGFNAAYDLTSDTLTVGATLATISVGSSLIITGKGLGFTLQPDSSTGNDDVTVVVASGSVSLPQEGVSGSIDAVNDTPGLTITNDGFEIASATLTDTSSAPFSAFNNKFSITDPSATLTDFGYSIKSGANFNSDLTLTATEIDFDPTSTVSVKATGSNGSPVSATISFKSGDPGHMTFQATNVTADLGTYLTLSGSNIAFDTDPASGGNYFTVSDLSAQLTAGPVDVTGSMTGSFSVDSNGNFDTSSDFGVSVNLTSSGSVKWPSWLPIQISQVAVAWPNFQTDPEDFTLDLSASVNAKIGSSGISVSGSVTDAVIDVGLLSAGSFPIISLGGASLGVSGTIFGADITGSAVFGIADVTSTGTITTDPSQTVSRIFYGGIQGGISFEGAAGFDIRLGISTLGPLDAFIEVDDPILLDPESGLAVTDLQGSIAFDQSLQTVTDPTQLVSDTDLTNMQYESATTWASQLAAQVALQAKAQAAGMSVLDEPITISAGATFFDEYATENAFELTGDVLFDTTGKIEASGTLTLGDSLTVKGAVYADLSKASEGDASLLFYAEAPTVTDPLATVYGSVVITTGGDLILNGVNQDAQTAGNGISLDNTSFTVQFDARRADTNRAETLISQGADGLQVGFDAENNFVVTMDGETLVDPVTDDAWHNWAITYTETSPTSGTLELFKDGQPIMADGEPVLLNGTPLTLTTGPIVGGGKTLYIGSNGTSSYFDGGIDAVRVWNIPLSASTIQANYLSGSVSKQTGLIGAWNFDTGTETQATDLSGSGTPLSIIGSPSFSIPAGTTPAPFAKDGGFEIAVSGQVDLSLPGLQGGLDIVGSASFQVDTANNSFDLTVGGYADLDPIGQIASLSGFVHFDESKGSPELWGAALITSNLSQIPAFKKIGLVAGDPTLAFLRFNTTSVTQTALLTTYGASSTTSPPPTSSTSYSLPPDAFSIYVDGSIGIEDLFNISGTLYASFSYATEPNGSTDPELDIAFSANLSLGQSSTTVLTLSASGVLVINSAGLAAKLTVSPETSSSSALAQAGIDLSDTSISLTVNTTGKTESFTVPEVDVNGNPVPGSGVTYSVPGAPAVTNSPGDAPYLLVSGTGNLAISDFDLSGSFDMLATTGEAAQNGQPAVQPQFRLDVNNMNFTVTVNGTQLISLTAEGGILLESGGFAAALSITGTPALYVANVYELDATLLFEVNTTSSLQTVGGINISNNTLMLAGSGDLKVGPSDAQFVIDASFQITVNSSGLTVNVDGTADLGPLGNLATDDNLTITNEGIYGLLTLTASVAPFPGFVLNGQFQIEINTTDMDQPIAGEPDIPKDTLELAITGASGPGSDAYLIVADTITVAGQFELTVDGSGFTLDASGTISFLGATLATGVVDASIYQDSNGTELAFYAGLTLSGSTGIGGLHFSITASPSVEINTGSVAFPITNQTGPYVPSAVPAHTVQVALNNANISAFGLTLSGSVIATVDEGGFDIEIPQTDPLELSFGSLGNIEAYGYLDSNGSFSFTAVANYDVTLNLDVCTFELYGSIGVTIASSGFSAYFNGGANLGLQKYDLGTVNLVSINAAISVSGSYLEIKAKAKIGDLSLPSFDAQFGKAPSTPAGTPGLQFYNAPTFAGAGQDIIMMAQDNDSNGNPIPDGDYYWVVKENGSTYESYSSGTDDFTLGAPGTYDVSLFQDNGGIYYLLKQSTINVVEIPPTIPSIGLNAAYPVSVQVPFGSTIAAVNPSDLQYSWSVLKNGVPFNAPGENTAGFTFTPDAYPANAPPNHPVDTYTVTLKISDPYGGSATATGTFVALDPTNITVTSALDDVTAGDPNPTDPNVTFREAMDLILDNYDSGTAIPTIHFAPSLAGKTIVLTQAAYFTPNGPGGSDEGIYTSMIIDATDAPGLTIEGAPGNDRRLFYIGPDAVVTFRNITLEGGEAYGSGSNAFGGAIYDDGSVSAINTTFLNNSSVSTGTTLTSSEAFGGAVYVSGNPITLPNGDMDIPEFDAQDSTFSGNSASGGPGQFGVAGPAAGGAIYDNGGVVYLVSDTIAHNSVSSGTKATLVGSGIYAADQSSSISHSSELEVDNSIIADNTGATQFQTTDSNVIVTGDADNIITSSSGVPASLILTTQDPMLGLLAPRTDGAITYSLLPGSPAIDTGDASFIEGILDPGQIAYDQQDLPAVYNNQTDIGAFEDQPSIVVTNANGSGPGSLAEAVAGDDTGTPIVFASNLEGETIDLTTGPLDILSNITITGLGANELTINGVGTYQIFNVPSGVTATIAGLTLMDGFATEGGAIANAGNLTLNQVALLDNTAQGTAATTNLGAGGAIDNAAFATLTLNEVTFANNTAIGGNSYIDSNNILHSANSGRGGAIYSGNKSTITGTEVTFTNNTAQAGSQTVNTPPAYGGAIDDYGTLTFFDATFDDNILALVGNPSAPSKGADVAVENGGSLALTNSIAANPSGGDDIDVLSGAKSSGLDDLVMSSSNFSPGAIVSTANPMLRPLANYGGPMPTMILQTGSPAIGLGSATGQPSTDQRGLTRIVGGVVDLGATELQQYVVTTTADSGTGSLRWAVANDLDLTPITFNLPNGSTINLTSGPIVIASNLSLVGPGARELAINGDGQRVFTVSAGQVSISGLTIEGGQSEEGGGLYNSGTLTLGGDAFINDTAQGDQTANLAGLGAGGAIFNAPGGSLTVTGSTFSNDNAYGAPGVAQVVTDGRQQGYGGNAQGGAIDNVAGARLIAIDDTFINDTAQGGNGITWFNGNLQEVGQGGAGTGGAIDNAGSASIVNTTFVANSVHQGAQSPSNSSVGADVFIATGATLTLDNTIAAKGGTGGDIANDGTVSGSGNVVMVSTGLASGVVVSTADPDLGTLQYATGAQVQTISLSTQSTAFGLGILSAAPSLDELGNPRVVDGFVDPGAVELQVVPPTPSAGASYTINQGESLTLNASGTTNPSNSILSYEWFIDGAAAAAASGSSLATFTANQLQKLGLGVGTYQVQVEVSDGYGGPNHTLFSSPVALTILPTFEIASTTPAAPGAIQQAFASIDITLTDPANLNTRVPTGFLSLTLDGEPLPTTGFLLATVPGQPDVEELTGFSADNGEGAYVLTLNAADLNDSFGPGVGQTTISWTIDRTAPTSHVVALPTSETSTSFVVTATGTDPSPAPGVVASGIATYDLYVSTNGGAFAYWTTVPASDPSATFTGVGGNSYGFQSFATDAAGNREAKPTIIEAGTYVPNLSIPTSQVTAVNTSNQDFLISFAGSAASGNLLDHVDIYVSVDSASPIQISSVAAISLASTSGTISYQAIADGNSHSYAFYSIATDEEGNVQPTPFGPDAGTMVSASFAAPASNQPIALTVNHGAAGRSFVRYADVVFDNTAGLSALIANDQIQVVQHSLNDTGSTVVAPSSYSLSIVDHAIEIDFGPKGLGGNPLSTAGDGYYEIDIEGFARAFYFDRILGDVNGDGVVDSNDVNLVSEFLGSSVPGQAVDVDGSGTITSIDRTDTLRARGHQLASGLELDA